MSIFYKQDKTVETQHLSFAISVASFVIVFSIASLFLEQPFLKKESEKQNASNSIVNQNLSTSLNQANLENKLDEIVSVLNTEIKAGLLEVEATDNNIILRLTGGSSFNPNSAIIKPALNPVIAKIASVTAMHTGKIEVTGHTDNQALNNSAYQSNWDLSVARAASITNTLINNSGISTTSISKLSIIGFAGNKPLVKNDSIKNKKLNRRVEIILYY